jgi:ADP-ribosyl-[dinitrogen reductase] hydrolase
MDTVKEDDTMTNLADKISGALFGVAVGDALGAPLEFMSASEIARRYGTVKEMIGGGWLNVKPGEVTDDTQMTIAAALAVAMHPEQPEPWAGKHFAEWAMGGPKDIGGTCRSSISNALQMMLEQPELKDCKGLAPYELWEKASKLTAEQNGNRSAGNGALMRTVYPGLYYPDENRAVEVADRIGRLTHWDDLSAEACILYTKMLHFLIENHEEPTVKLVQGMKDIVRGTQYNGLGKNKNLNPSGFVVDSFNCALYCIRRTKNFENAVVMAANLGGDADTIAAITGGLAGALYGYEAIPLRWRTLLDHETKSTLISLTGDAAKSWEA